jgi:hypothetical protein
MDDHHQSVRSVPSDYIAEELELENMRVGDESQQPLIVDESDNDATALHQVTQKQANRLIWLLTLSAGLSGLLFGYE